MGTAARTGDSASGKTRRAIVKLLKTEGPLDSARLARRMGLTPMAVRQHLYALQREKLVTRRGAPGAARAAGEVLAAHARGGPPVPRRVRGTAASRSSARSGTRSARRACSACSSRGAPRSGRSTARASTSSAPLGDKLRALAKQRTEEGYMAEVRRDGDGFLFIENHCPICAAATRVPGLLLDRARSVPRGARSGGRRRARRAHRLRAIGDASTASLRV